MKIIIKESQYYQIVEQVGLDDVTLKMTDRYPDSVYAMETIVKFIKKSGCQKIEILPFKFPASGAALHDRVIINTNVLNTSFTNFLYVLFHEIAHQYQYKKYGIDKMYDTYTGVISVEEGAKFMKYVENVADEFSIRKLREIDKLHGHQINLNVKSIYKVYQNVPVSQFVSLIKQIIGIINDSNYKSKEDITEILYNHIKR